MDPRSVRVRFESALELHMDPSAIPVFLAGPFPVLHSARVDDVLEEVDLDVALLISGMPTMIAETTFDLDDTWERVRNALASGDARLGVAGALHEEESELGVREVFPAAYVGLECANGERLVLAHIRSVEAGRDADAYAREVIAAILEGQTPGELGVFVDD